MTSANDAAPKSGPALTLSQLLSIQALRIAEQEALIDDPALEAQVSKVAPRDAKGRLQDPKAAVARRAELYLPVHSGISKVGIEAFLYLVCLPLIGFSLLGLQYAGYYLAMVFVLPHQPGNTGGFVVNVGGYMGFLAVQDLFLLMVVVMMFTPNWVWFKLVPAGKWLPMFGVSGILTTLARLAAHVIPTSWLDRSVAASAAVTTDTRYQRVVLYPRLLDELLIRKPGLLGALSTFVSHSFWLILSTWSLMLLFGWLFVYEYDFRWPSTILPDRWIQGVVDELGNPIRWAVETPEAEDIRWLLQEEGHGRASSTLPAENLVRSRIRWGWFLLALQFFYGVVPRALFWLISLVMVRYELRRAYEPQWVDPYFRQVLDRIEHPTNAQTATETNQADVPQAELLGPKPERIASAAETKSSGPEAPVESAANGNGAAQVTLKIEEPPLPPPVVIKPPWRTVVCGYEIYAPPGSWKTLLDLPGDVEDRGNPEGKSARDDLLDWLEEHREEIARLILIVELSATPTASTKLFLEGISQRLRLDAERFVILTGSENFRRRRQGDPKKSAERVRNWQEYCVFLRAPAEHVLDEFDHEHWTPTAGQRLRERLSGARAGGKLLRAGKFPQAAELILQTARSGHDFGDTEIFAREAAALQAKIDQLYRTEREWFRQWMEKLPLDAATLQKTSAQAEQALGTAGTTLQTGMRETASCVGHTWTSVAELAKNLKPRWLVGGALAGLIAGGAIVPAVSLPVLILPYVLPVAGVAGAGMSQWLGDKVSAWTSRRKTSATSEATVETITPGLENLVSSALLWALILELQGNPAEEIARTLETLLGPLADHPLHQIEHVEQTLRQVSADLDRLAATGEARHGT